MKLLFKEESQKLYPKNFDVVGLRWSLDTFLKHLILKCIWGCKLLSQSLGGTQLQLNSELEVLCSKAASSIPMVTERNTFWEGIKWSSQFLESMRLYEYIWSKGVQRIFSNLDQRSVVSLSLQKIACPSSWVKNLRKSSKLFQCLTGLRIPFLSPCQSLIKVLLKELQN